MSASSWWMFHGGSAHSGEVTSSTITSQNVARLELMHDIPISGPVLSVPALVDGDIYVGIANATGTPGVNGGEFHKISVATGKVLATFRWTVASDQGDSHGFMGMGCTPAVAGGSVFFSAFDGKLYCLEQATLTQKWVTDLRHADLAHNQPVTNVSSPGDGYPNAAGWSSPVVVANRVYVGFGEGENPTLYGFVYCLDALTGDVLWIYCTCQFKLGTPNVPNLLPASMVGELPPMFDSAPDTPIRGCSVWSSIAYDEKLNRLFMTTGNPQPDGALPTPGFSNGILSLDAATGEFRGFFQAPPESSYRTSDVDVDFGGSAMLFELNGKRMVAAGCKNGGFFVLDAETMTLLNWRQLLPFYNSDPPNIQNGPQIPTVDPHLPQIDSRINPWVPNEVSNAVQQENFYGTYSTPAFRSSQGVLFIGVGGNNYHNIAAGIDSTTTPFMRAMDAATLRDVWQMDAKNHNPARYIRCAPPMYETPGEGGLSSPVVVNDVVFCSTNRVALHAFNAADGTTLWSDLLGGQTGGINGGYGYCLGPAVEKDFLVAGGLVFGGNGGVLRVYSLPSR